MLGELESEELCENTFVHGKNVLVGNNIGKYSNLMLQRIV